VATLDPPAGVSLLRVWTDGTGKLDTLMSEGRNRIAAFMPRVSPDGRLVAFQERLAGDVYVLPLAAGGGALQVSESPAGYQRPVLWGPDSRHLFYGAANGLNTITLDLAPSLRVAGRNIKSGFPVGPNYDLAPDGKTFVMVNPLNRVGGIQVVVNWTAQARRTWSGPTP